MRTEAELRELLAFLERACAPNRLTEVQFGANITGQDIIRYCLGEPSRMETTMVRARELLAKRKKHGPI